MLGGGVDAAALVAALGAGRRPPSAAGAAAPTVGPNIFTYNIRGALRAADRGGHGLTLSFSYAHLGL